MVNFVEMGQQHFRVEVSDATFTFPTISWFDGQTITISSLNKDAQILYSLGIEKYNSHPNILFWLLVFIIFWHKGYLSLVQNRPPQRKGSNPNLIPPPGAQPGFF